MEFSILIPSWNNLGYLKHCIRSIELNSTFSHQIIVIANEAKDGTLDWLKSNKYHYIHHQENVGICVGLNSASSLILKEYVVYLNDDMYVLPNWDKAFANEISSISQNDYMLSGTMIEPRDTGNKCVLIADFGDDLESFDESAVLEYHKTAHKSDWSGATWPPILLPTHLWNKVGGMSEEFSPGMYSDPDLSMKVWQEGVRYFKGLGNARVYHFGSKSTTKLGKNVGRRIFLKKWNMTSGYFYKKHLKMGEKWAGPLQDYRLSLFDLIKNRVKKIIS